MGKTLDEILNREDYKGLNEALKERTLKLAEIIRDEMEYLQIKKIGDYKLITRRSHSNGTSTTDLYVLCEVYDDYGDYSGTEYRCLGYRNSFHFYGDYNCFIECAKTRDRIKFLNDAKSIFLEIDRIKTERCHEIETLLDETAELVDK